MPPSMGMAALRVAAVDARTSSTPNGRQDVGDGGELVGPDGVDLDHVAAGPAT